MKLLLSSSKFLPTFTRTWKTDRQKDRQKEIHWYNRFVMLCETQLQPTQNIFISKLTWGGNKLICAPLCEKMDSYTAKYFIQNFFYCLFGVELTNAFNPRVSGADTLLRLLCPPGPRPHTQIHSCRRKTLCFLSGIFLLVRTSKLYGDWKGTWLSFQMNFSIMHSCSQMSDFMDGGELWREIERQFEGELTFNGSRVGSHSRDLPLLNYLERCQFPYPTPSAQKVEILKNLAYLATQPLYQ